MDIVVVSGGFDPLHSGHLKYLNSAKQLGDLLIVLLNSDEWLIKKKSKYFLPFSERKTILENLAVVDKVLGFNDDEHGSCINGLKEIKKEYSNSKIIFCNGGDRNKKNIPELSLTGIDFVFDIGGSEKLNSSSKILQEYNNNSEYRVWGKFHNLFHKHNTKVKELIIYPESGISYQRHFKRSELWYVIKGSCKVKFSSTSPDKADESIIRAGEIFQVPKLSWHQIINPNKENCHIIEIQYGSETDESDIERLEFYKNNKKQ